MGDVALSVPIIKSLSVQYPDYELFMITRKTFNPFFSDIKKLTLINPDFKGKHKGIKGLFKLFKEIKEDVKPDIFIDIHNVLRTKILRVLFSLSGIKSYIINKGRKEKKKLCKKSNKKLFQLKHSAQRYIDVFLKAGIKFKINNKTHFPYLKSNANYDFLNNKSSKKIGIAPFAMHEQKQYPIVKMKELISLLNQKSYKIYIFGGGKKEKYTAKTIEAEFENVISLIGKFSLKEEIEIISNLDLMISMDSANMHIAALTGIKIVSIWGATHPFAGFTPFISDDKSFIIQNKNLACRPCSVFGNKKCYKNSLECFETIEAKEIFSVCEKALK